MNAIARRLLIFALFVLMLSPVVLLILYYRSLYAALELYHVEGIGICWLGSYVLANLCALSLMQGAGNKTDYENSGAFEIIKLYLFERDGHYFCCTGDRDRCFLVRRLALGFDYSASLLAKRMVKGCLAVSASRNIPTHQRIQNPGNF